MAVEMTIGSASVKRRGIVEVFAFAIITLGIYLLFWMYFVAREMRDFGRERGNAELASISPGMMLILSFIPIVNLFMWHKYGTSVIATQQAAGIRADYSMAVHWILHLFTGLGFLYMQHGLNSAWDSQGSIGSSSAAPTAGTASDTPFVGTGS